MPSLEKKPPGASAPSPGIDLVIVFSGGEVLELPRRYRLSPAGLLVGREAPEGISLSNDPRASRRHATLRADASGARVKDEGSSNGTFVNGARADDVALSDGDVVAIGDSLFVVSAEPANVGDADLPDLVGTSPAVRRLRAELSRAAPGVSVVLLGERGGDQEAAARALHALSGRTGPFVTFDCGALPEGLAKSQLFGHSEGAFAGATALPGLFRAAEGGTLFLDELGQLPPALQPKLLRALQDRAVWPAGATLPQPYDVRVIAATDRDPHASASASASASAPAVALRPELYARLAESSLHVPSLRERREDALRLFVQSLNAPRPRFEPDLAERLLLHDWPGNMRELHTLARQLRIRGGWGPYGLPLLESLLPPRSGAPASGRAR